MIFKISVDRKEKTSCLATMLKTSFVKGNGYGSFFVATFNSLKFAWILNFSFFLGTTTMTFISMHSYHLSLHLTIYRWQIKQQQN